MSQNPWQVAVEKFPAGEAVSGKVTRTTDFGAFVELEPGMEGLIHISELAWKRVGQVTDVVQAGQQVEVKVLEVDPNRKRISLSLKQMQARPEREQRPRKPQDSDLAPSGGEPYKRRRKGRLKGGTSSDSSGGGLFGNPNDFGN